jgi:hypothetical protein
MKIYLTIAESLGTDNEFSSEVFVSTSEQQAREMATSLIADMIEEMYDGDEEIDPTKHWDLEGDGWFYRVRIESYEVPESQSKLKKYATNIIWDTDDEDIDYFNLPSRVEIPKGVDVEDIADYLSDEFFYCVKRFDVDYVQ